MNLYRLEDPNADYDEDREVVVLARDRVHARNLIFQNARRRKEINPGKWRDDRATSCRKVRMDQPSVVLVHFRAGPVGHDRAGVAVHGRDAGPEDALDGRDVDRRGREPVRLLGAVAELTV